MGLSLNCNFTPVVRPLPFSISPLPIRNSVVSAPYLHKGDRHTVGSAEVNDYLREITGEEITAKDFRTWAGTKLAAEALREFELFDTEAERKKAVLRAVEKVAKHLGNTPAICRSCYIHPAVLDGYLDGSLLKSLAEETPGGFGG